MCNGQSTPDQLLSKALLRVFKAEQANIVASIEQ